MHKMAVFVEGYTELLFIESLINEVAKKNQVAIEARQLNGQRAALLRGGPPQAEETHFIFILDCRNDALVKTRMLQEYSRLTTAGYTSIICIRDLYPNFSYGDLARLEREIKWFVPTKPVVVEFVFEVMEAEAWFLAEHTHFERVDPAITCDLICSTLNFDPRKDNLEMRPHPAADLHNCYQLAGKSYLKGNAAQMSNLDFSNIYLTVSDRFNHLRRLCRELDHFLSLPAET
jgi:hypothetical protein